MVGSNSGASKPDEKPGRCGLLLGGLIALLVCFPFLEEVTRPLVLMIPLACTFVAGVFAADADRHHVRTAVIIAAVQIGFTCASLTGHETPALYVTTVSLALAATVLLIIFSTWCVLRYVLKAQVIARDQIYAGICMYLMLGFAFGAVFYLVNILDANSFSVNSAELGRRSAPDLMYFSFITLATLGYGDITPLTNIARSLAVLEAVAGMIFIAVFMARLVSLAPQTYRVDSTLPTAPSDSDAEVNHPTEAEKLNRIRSLGHPYGAGAHREPKGPHSQK